MDAADLRAVFAALPGSVLVLAPDAPRFTMLAASDARLAATRTTREAILGRGLFDAFRDANPGNPDPTGVANLGASLERVLATGAPDRMPDQRYDRRGGRAGAGQSSARLSGCRNSRFGGHAAPLTGGR